MQSNKALFDKFCLYLFAQRDAVLLDPQRDPLELHKNLSSLIKQAQDANTDNVDLAYIMAALSDEILLNIEWDGKLYWENNMLEQKFFGSQTAGDTIFANIEQLVQGDVANLLETGEIYLKLLALGFLGKYRGLQQDIKEFNKVRHRLFDVLERADKSIFFVEHRLFQGEYAHTIPTKRKQLLPDTNNILYICFSFTFLFLVIGSIVWAFETKDLYRILSEISLLALSN